MTMPTARDFDAYAERIIRVAVNLQPGQDLVIAAPEEAAGLVDHIARAARSRGAAEVHPVYDAPEQIRDQLLENSSFQQWASSVASISKDVTTKLREGAAHLTIHAPRPDLLEGLAVDRIAKAHAALAAARAEEAQILSSGLTNASAALFVTAPWARCVFPGKNANTATAMLWRALFDGLQIDADEAAVRAHAAELVLRRARIQALELRALAIRGVDIDMKVGLADGHVWRGGETQSASGIPFLPALPSDALFTAPAARHGEGAIAFSRPIAIAGDIVTDLSARFLAGEVTEITARSGKDGFERLLNSAAGARRLGKIALVERTAPFARQALHFLNPMMDGASAPHIAFGTPLSSTLHDGAGANQSTLHIDAIFDGADIAVDGVDSTGRANALMREGLFVI